MWPYTPSHPHTRKKKKKKKKKLNNPTKIKLQNTSLTENLRIQEISKEGKKEKEKINLQLELAPSTVDKEKLFQ